jgi:hypothetical protein
MNQRRAKHKLARINTAYSALNIEFPISLDWYTVKDCHKGSNCEPDDGARLEDLDPWSDVGDAEQTPVEAENSQLGASERPCVKELGHEKPEASILVYFLCW